MIVAACGGDGGSSDGNPDAAPSDGPGDGAASSCGTTGSGTVTGSVGGATIAPVARAFQISIPGAGVVIVLDEAAASCGEAGAGGEHLVLGFCDVPTARTYPVVGEQAFDCPSQDVFGLVEQGSMDFAESTDGTVTITGATASCVTGTFTMNLRAASGSGDPEPLSGSFDAVICP